MKDSHAPAIDDFVSELLGDAVDPGEEKLPQTEHDPEAMAPLEETHAAPQDNPPALIDTPADIPDSPAETLAAEPEAQPTETAPLAEAEPPVVMAQPPEAEIDVEPTLPAAADSGSCPIDLEQWLQPASHPSEEQFHAPLLRCVSFKLQGQVYAAEVDSLLEVMPRADIVQIPSKGYPVLGILNLRGNIVTVIDPAALLGLNANHDRDGRLIVVDYEFEPVALRVDEVMEVVSLDETELQAAPDSAKHVRGLIECNGDMLSLLDLKKLVAKAFK